MTVTPLSTAPTVLIRAARGSDGKALARLAQLDSARLPTGELLVAESDGRLVAAVELESGAVIADPFRPTADVVDLLAVRADRLRSAGRRSLAMRLGLRPAPHARAA
jgi:hypothetical protein